MPSEDNGCSIGQHGSVLANLCAGEAETTLPVRSNENVVMLRKMVREHLLSMQFSVLDQLKVITAVSELARKVLRYGGGEHYPVVKVIHEGRSGLSITFIDQSPALQTFPSP
jgi:serine/threonine-protein kinase RsbT